MPLSPSEFFKELINTPDINKMSPEQRKKNIWMIKRKNSEKMSRSMEIIKYYNI